MISRAVAVQLFGIGRVESGKIIKGFSLNLGDETPDPQWFASAIRWPAVGFDRIAILQRLG